MRIVFMGSPTFGVPVLRALRSAEHRIVLVVSQPDRPAGRSRRPTPPPVADLARRQSLPLYQPSRPRAEAALAPIQQARPDVVVVAAYGLLLPETLLSLPPLGCLNVHPSLLPRYRGASPIQAALLAGDEETGATIIQLTPRMDAGPILAQLTTPIAPDEDAPRLEARLAELGAELLVETLEPWARGALRPEPQDETAATYCPKLERADAQLDWSRPAPELARRVRAFRGRTDAFTYWGGRLLKVLAAEAVPAPPDQPRPGSVYAASPPTRPRRPLVATGDGALLLREVALEGRAATSGEAFLNGYPRFLGAHLAAKVANGDSPHELH